MTTKTDREEIIKKIQQYMIGKEQPSIWDVDAFIGMIETGEATWADFTAAGLPDHVVAGIAKSKQNLDDIRAEQV